MPRLIRVFEQLKSWRGLLDVLRVDNGPELLAHEFAAWANAHGMMIDYIEPGEPNQNAYMERFNRTYRDEVLNLYLFEGLEQVLKDHASVADRLQRASTARLVERSVAGGVCKNVRKFYFSTVRLTGKLTKIIGYHGLVFRQ